MKILNLRQGSAEWHAHRATKKNASDAPAMLGESPHCTRDELMRRMKTGIAADVDGGTQKRFDKGHAVEDLLRALAEKQLDEPLHPFVGVADFDESLSASLDGSTFVGDVLLECKLLNARLRAAFGDMESIAPEHRERSACQSLPIDYRIQMEQQVRVAEADRILFMAGELREDGTLGDVFSCWYYPDDALWARIQAGWKQFDVDLATYEPPPVDVSPVIVARSPEQLPSLRSSVSGSLVLDSNIKEWEEAALAYIKGVRDHELKTDEDFANADAAAKWCESSKSTLLGARAQLMAATGDVNVAVGTLDRIMSELDKTRIAFSNAIKERKDARKLEIVSRAKAALGDHIAALNARLGNPYMPALDAKLTDFAGAVKGLSSLKSMEQKANGLLTTAKLEANRIADVIDLNLRYLREHAKDHAFLFADTAQLVLKDAEFVVMTVKTRISEHDAAEQRKAEELAERERERIRAEEAARLEREQQERLAEERRQREAAEAQSRRDQQAAMRHTNGAPMFGQHVKENGDRVMLDERGNRSVFCDVDEGDGAQPPASAPLAAPAPVSQAPNVVPLQQRAQPATAPTLRLGVINQRIAPLSIDAAGLEALGFPPAATEKSAKLYHEHQFGAMVDSMVAQLRAAQHQQQAA